MGLGETPRQRDVDSKNGAPRNSGRRSSCIPGSGKPGLTPRLTPRRGATPLIYAAIRQPHYTLGVAMFDGVTPTKFGRNHKVEALDPGRLHFHAEGAPLREVSHQLGPVLDQEDLHKQGIDTSKVVPGAPRVNALGSCTANATAVSVAERYTAAGKPLPAGLSRSDAVQNEKWAIRFYAADTARAGNPWPPTDSGSTGRDCCLQLEHEKLIGSYKAPVGVLGALSALQSGTVIQGTPFFYAWMQPDRHGFIDGDGSADALQAAIESGIAGGHETCQYGIAQLAMVNGKVDLHNTVIEVRNSWSKAWGLSGCFRLHASTLDMLAQYVDYKQFVV